MATGHPISSLGKVASAMRTALDEGKTGADVVRAVDRAFSTTTKAGKTGK